MRKFKIQNKIILTDKYNTTTTGVQFPKTPPPDVRSEGIFHTKEEIFLRLKNKLKRQ